MVAITEYKKIAIYHSISYLTVSNDDDLNITNNETSFTELKRFSEESFEIKFHEGFLLKYLIFRIFKFHINFIIYHTDHIMELVNKWFPTGNILKVYTPFLSDSTYEKEIMIELPIT